MKHPCTRIYYPHFKAHLMNQAPISKLLQIIQEAMGQMRHADQSCLIFEVFSVTDN